VGGQITRKPSIPAINQPVLSIGCLNVTKALDRQNFRLLASITTAKMSIRRQMSLKNALTGFSTNMVKYGSAEP
jgi:hypothetical protein